ncbi:N-acetylmuramoyl-L-alanine amidase [Streptomyces sp. NPDC052236]|uniref:N-acetylmuramoyl-L-alanine amidase n=1 Tax=Streptomyces sp. NPDC052236 TaxID=3365686 RepID=UPI0037CF3591
MATPLTASTLLKALRNEGLRVVEHRSWRTHNRNHKGPWGPVYGVMIHHTVTSGTQSSVDLCYNGHSTLPGPLCHGVIAKDGSVHMVGNGRANHAGLGDDDVLRAVINEVALPTDNEANTDGNRHFYGFECINLGDGKDPWPAAQLEAIEKASAAICRAHGWSSRSVIGHKEWQPGKIDPRGFTMDSMRTRIKDRLTGMNQEDDVPSMLSEFTATLTNVPAGKWTTLAMAVDAKMLQGPLTAYDVNVQLRVRGCLPGAKLQGRFYHYQTATKKRSEGLAIDAYGPAEGGDAYPQYRKSGALGAGWELRFEFFAHNDRAVSIAHRVVEGPFWPAD